MKTRLFLFTADAHVSKAVAKIAGRADWVGGAANNVREGLAFLRECEWDIAIVDIGHRGAGFLMLDALENSDHETPVIVLTEPNAGYFQALALANGASEVLATPVGTEELREAVMRLHQDGFRA
jgi:DNA-binding response OmpR family regulator